MSTTVVVSVITKFESHLEKSGNGKLLPTGYLALILVGLLPLWGSAVASTLNAGSTAEEGFSLSLTANSENAPHYHVDARIEPTSGRIDVELNMRWVPTQPTDALTFLLHRDLGRPRIESSAVADVRVEPVRRFAKAFDSDTSYTNRVTIALTETASPDNPVEIRWSYDGTLDTDRIRLGASAIASHWIELQIGSLWVPVAESLREPFTFDATVDLPEDFDVVSSGSVERDGTTHRIRSMMPNSDLPLIASDEFQTVRSTGDGPPVTVYHAGAPDSLTAFVADQASRLLNLYDHMFRTGRDLNTLRIVLPPIPRARPNGYARPGLISLKHDEEASPGTFGLLAHEAAHLWWTDAADSQSRHNFLNESFAEYSSFLAYQEFYGESAFEKRLERAQKEAAELPAIRNWSAKLNHPLLYRKGPWLLHQLHERIGEEAFLRFVRRLQQESTGTLEDMIEVLKRTTNPETARWFDERLST